MMSRTLPEPALAKVPVPDRRRHFRHVCALDRKGFVCPSGERYPWPVHVHNLSRGGMSLRLGCNVEPSTAVRVYIHNALEDVTVEIPGQIIWAIGFPGDEYVLGCSFGRDLSDAELAELL